MSDDSGPFMSEDGDSLFLPVSSWGWNQAQREAKFWADDMEPGAKADYCGKQSTAIHDHEEPWHADDDCPMVACYVFELNSP